MKKAILLGLFVLISGSILLAEITVNRPRFLVNNQLIPYAVKLQGDIPISNSNISNTAGNQNFKQSSLFFDSYIIPAVSTPKNLLILGAGYMADQIETDNSELHNKNYKGLYLNIFATGSLGEKWFWFTYQSAGSMSNKIFDTVSQSLKYFQISKIGYKWTANLATSLGLLFVSNFGKPVIIPLVNISYSVNHIVLNAELPTKIDFEFVANTKLRIYGEGVLSAKSYSDKNTNNSLYFNENKTTLGLKYNIIKYTWMNIGLSKSFNNKYIWGNSEIPIGTVMNDYRLSVGVLIHIN